MSCKWKGYDKKSETQPVKLYRLVLFLPKFDSKYKLVSITFFIYNFFSHSHSKFIVHLS